MNRKDRFFKYLRQGLSGAEAARKAGYAKRSASKQAYRLKKQGQAPLWKDAERPEALQEPRTASIIPENPIPHTDLSQTRSEAPKIVSVTKQSIDEKTSGQSNERLTDPSETIESPIPPPPTLEPNLNPRNVVSDPHGREYFDRVEDQERMRQPWPSSINGTYSEAEGFVSHEYRRSLIDRALRANDPTDEDY